MSLLPMLSSLLVYTCSLATCGGVCNWKMVIAYDTWDYVMCRKKQAKSNIVIRHRPFTFGKSRRENIHTIAQWLLHDLMRSWRSVWQFCFVRLEMRAKKYFNHKLIIDLMPYKFCFFVQKSIPTPEYVCGKMQSRLFETAWNGITFGVIIKESIYVHSLD